MHMLCHILVKCRDLRTLSHLAEMSRFVAFWQKCCQAQNAAPRHLKLFCTPAHNLHSKHNIYSQLFNSVLEILNDFLPVGSLGICLPSFLAWQVGG